MRVLFVPGIASAILTLVSCTTIDRSAGQLFYGDERMNELLALLEAGRFQQSRKISKRIESVPKDGVGVDRIVGACVEFLQALLEASFLSGQFPQLGVDEPLLNYYYREAA